VRAVVVDLDGTVLDRTFHPSPRTVKAIALTRAAGMHVLVATGRMFVSARRIAAELGVDDPLVCYQGALVGDPRTGEILFHKPLDVELARELLRALGPWSRTTNVYLDDELYVTELNDAARHYAQTAGVEAHVVGDLAAWLPGPTTKLVTVGDPVLLDGERDRLQAAFGDRAFIAKSLPEFLEIAAPGVSKAASVSLVGRRLGFGAAETIAFGDGENDRELLEWAGLGVAVEGGDPGLAQRADWKVPSVHDDGVARFLESLVAARG
jgi:Cof subfamily protein (haloacid dehalogenase superfamily)